MIHEEISRKSSDQSAGIRVIRGHFLKIASSLSCNLQDGEFWDLAECKSALLGGIVKTAKPVEHQKPTVPVTCLARVRL